MAFVRAIVLRRVRGDHHLAEDVTRAVFIVLTRRAKAAARSASLRGWLRATTCYAASNATRAAARRDRHEAKVDRSHESYIADDPAALAASADEWAAIDTALCELGSKDRDALMLRYADGQSLPQAAAAIGTTPEAAKKRVQRALDRLRQLLRRRGTLVSLADRLPALSIVPALDGNAMHFAGGANGQAFMLARKVVTEMRMRTMKLAAAISLTSIICIGGAALAQPNRKANKVDNGAVIAAAPPC